MKSKIMKKVITSLLGIILLVYLLICSWFYFSQEKLLFNDSVKLKNNHIFKFTEPFQEHYITMKDNTKLHGVLFKAKQAKGLMLWLPGGRGMIDSIGTKAHLYTRLNYDFFILNYRGFGKSKGKISSENQLNEDLQTVYDYFKRKYPENNIIISGYSLGTGPASLLAANNHPKMLILNAPYYSMVELSKKAFPYIPVSLLQKYRFSVADNLLKTKCKVVIFHGEEDKKIPLEVSYRLKKNLKPTDLLFVLKNQGHDKLDDNQEYWQKLYHVTQ